MKPIIGILANTKMTSTVNEEIHLNCSYINAIEKGGGIPIIIPISTDEDNIKSTIEKVDGLLIPGGVDVNPLYYNEEPQILLGEINGRLDEFNLIATKIALELNKPILGICRGAQVLNICLGGTIYQDISYTNKNFVKHSQNAKGNIKTHSVEIVNSELLESILGKEIDVNSFHHQSVKDLGKNLKASAYSKDGIIEAIEKEDAKFVVGIQWHPELLVDNCDKMLNLFKTFVNKCIN